MAFFSPWWASEVTSSTPLSPRAVSDRQEGQPERAVLAGPHVHTQDLTLPVGIDPRRHHHADVDDAAALPHLLGQAVQPDVGGRDRRSRGRPRKLSTTSSSCSQMRDTWLLEMPSQPRALIRSSTRRVETPST